MLLQLPDLLAQSLQLRGIFLVLNTLCVSNFSTRRIKPCFLPTFVVIFAIWIGARLVFVAVGLWVEESALIAVSTLRKMKAVLQTMVKWATLVTIEAACTISTLLVGRLSVALVWTFLARDVYFIILLWRYEQ